MFCPLLHKFILKQPWLPWRHAQWCTSWTWLEPAVSGTGQPWPLLEGPVPAGPFTPKNFPVVPQTGSQNHAPQILVNNSLVVGPFVPYLALDSKMSWWSGFLGEYAWIPNILFGPIFLEYTVKFCYRKSRSLVLCFLLKNRHMECTSTNNKLVNRLLKIVFCSNQKTVSSIPTIYLPTADFAHSGIT